MIVRWSSIFVNPTQFNDPAIWRNIQERLKKIWNCFRKLEADVVFVPSVEEMYPEEDQQTIRPGGPGPVMEGKLQGGTF